jgi:ankyrin repeat protein
MGEMNGFGENGSDENQLAIIEMLLENGADVNASNRLGLTPLHSAVCTITLNTIVFSNIENLFVDKIFYL